MKLSRILPVSHSSYDLMLASLLLMTPAIGIWLHYISILPLRVALFFLTPPAVIIAGFLTWRSGKSLTARIATFGLLGGFIATLAYDGVRLVLFWLGTVSQPFRSIEQWGILIAGSNNSVFAQWAGWLFHFWNGTSFGMFFALAFGRPTIIKGILWGLFLELALVIASPKLLALTIQDELLTSSLIGHIAYGIALGSIVAHAHKQRNPSK